MLKMTNIDKWNTSEITNMAGLFKNKTGFNGDISAWDTSNVENMSEMFYNASSFQGYLGEWKIGKVKNMQSMFYGASKFKSDLKSWNKTKVSDVKSMFYDDNKGTQNEKKPIQNNVNSNNINSINMNSLGPHEETPVIVNHGPNLHLHRSNMNFTFRVGNKPQRDSYKSRPKNNVNLF